MSIFSLRNRSKTSILRGFQRKRHSFENTFDRVTDFDSFPLALSSGEWQMEPTNGLVCACPNADCD